MSLTIAIVILLLLLMFALVWIFFRVKFVRQVNDVKSQHYEHFRTFDLEEYIESKFPGVFVTEEDENHDLIPFWDSIGQLAGYSRRMSLFCIKDKQLEIARNTDSIDCQIQRHNDDYMNRRLQQNKIFFDTVLDYPLDFQQRRSIVSEEMNCLVVSSAGSGKTSSIVGKVEYLTKVLHIAPQRILLISYTHKAATELTERMKIPGLKGFTFHKLAVDIISSYEGKKPSVCENTDALFVAIYRDLIRDVEFRKNVLKYFVDYSDFIELDNDEQTKKQWQIQSEESLKSLFPDMSGERVKVKSQQEKKVCLLLTTLGVQYRYEEPYEYDVADERHSQYRPDFSIHYEMNGVKKRIYLELFGIDEHSMVPVWFARNKGLTYEQANNLYNDGITWKRELHQQKGTTLLELSSADFMYCDVKQKLQNLLAAEGVPVAVVPDGQLFDNLIPARSEQEKSIIRFMATFVTLMKASGKSFVDVRNAVMASGKQRDLFIVENLMEPVCQRYIRMLNESDRVDFTDLIVKATNIVGSKKVSNYDYIIVDEFQDISMDRYMFLKALRGSSYKNKAKLYCVGDDWQSIYRFSGSDMTLFSRFAEYFGKTDLNKIETTYRFGNPLVHDSAEFIQRNPVQIRKNIHPFNPNVQTGLDYVGYSKNSFLEVLEQLIAAVPKDKSVFLLGRYSFDDYVVSRHYGMVQRGDSKFYNISNREVEFLTVHKSKGLEADYVILLHCNSGQFGFPSVISDDPVLRYLLSKGDDYIFGEERRLFYVAITRAKNKTTVLYDKYKPSVFVLERLHPEKLSGKPLSPHRNSGERWSKGAEQKVAKLYARGLGVRKIAQIMGRSQTAIIYRLNKMGLIDVSKPVRW